VGPEVVGADAAIERMIAIGRVRPQAVERQVHGGEIVLIERAALGLACVVLAESRLPTQGEDVVIDVGFRLARGSGGDSDQSRGAKRAHQAMAGLNKMPSTAGAALKTARSPSTRTLPSATRRSASG